MELTFDSPNTEDLLEKYLQEHNREFRPILADDRPSTEYQLDACNNRIYLLEGFEPPNLSVDTDRSDQRSVLNSIAQKVRELAELFVQIEAKTRGIEADQIRRCDIELIAKEFQHYSEVDLEGYEPKIDWYNRFVFTADMPLCACALLARCLRRVDSVHVICKDVQCAVALHLFVRLCLEAGYPAQRIAYSFEPDTPFMSSRGIESNGTTAVVTRTADIESAVACLLAASQDYQYPWRLRRILVQESALARFRRALARSTERGACEHPQLAGRSASAHWWGRKGFLVEFCGAAADVTARQRVVPVAAYRTTRELLALLRELPPAYLSLWCSDVSVSSEVALAARCSVCLNDCGWLAGPHRRSLSSDCVDHLAALYWIDAVSKPKEVFNEVEERITELRAAWLKLSYKKRREVILDVLRSSDLALLAKDLAKYEPRTFVCVEDGTSYQGFEEPRGIVACLFRDNDLREHLMQFLRSLVSGNGLLFIENADLASRILVQDLESAGVPIMISKLSFEDLFKCKAVDGVCVWHQPIEANERGLFKTRVISCHYGETFAN